jgi:hypothetical protein
MFFINVEVSTENIYVGDHLNFIIAVRPWSEHMAQPCRSQKASSTAFRHHNSHTYDQVIANHQFQGDFTGNTSSNLYQAIY